LRIIASGLQFPEGPVAMPDGSIRVVEIARETLSRVLPGGRVEVVANIPGGPNGAALGPDGRIYICNNGGFAWVREGATLRPQGAPRGYKGGSIDVVDIGAGKVERLYDRAGPNKLNGPNDLVFDAHGGFYFTDIGRRYDRVADRGYVYYAKADGSSISEVVTACTTPNGIGLSPDGRTLYVAETETARLWAWAVVAPGELAKLPWPSPCGGRCIAGIGGYTRFDSLAVAASGNICVAALDGCAVIEIAHNGGWRRWPPMPDLLVTNMCFGGDDLRTAFVTLSYEGKLAATRWHEPGLRLNQQAIGRSTSENSDASSAELWTYSVARGGGFSPRGVDLFAGRLRVMRSNPNVSWLTGIPDSPLFIENSWALMRGC
jgi:gluconolactonase